MRALSVDEATVLRAMVLPDGTGIHWTDDDPDSPSLDAAHAALVDRGAAVVRVYDDPDDPDAEILEWSHTELGALALRVSVPT